MLDTVLEALPRIGVGLGVLLLLGGIGRLVGVGVRRRYFRLQRPSFANVMSRLVALAFGLVGALAALTIVLPTIKPVDVRSQASAPSAPRRSSAWRTSATCGWRGRWSCRRYGARPVSSRRPSRSCSW